MENGTVACRSVPVRGTRHLFGRSDPRRSVRLDGFNHGVLLPELGLKVLRPLERYRTGVGRAARDKENKRDEKQLRIN